jgi:hypothetical protein
MLDQVLRRDGITIKDVQVKIMPTLAEDKGVALRPLARPAGAKAVPITAAFWNAEWAKANADLAHKVMLGYLKYTEFLSADKLFTITHRDRALKELGRR